VVESSPLQASVVQAGAVLAEQSGWSVPEHFGDPAAEYAAARRNAVVFDASSRTKVLLAGADAAKFLHSLCSNDILKLPRGAGCETFWLNIKARVIAHGFVWHELQSDQASFWVDSVGGLAEKLLKHLDHYLISERVTLADQTHELAQLHVAGPAAAEIVSQALGKTTNELAPMQQICPEWEGEVLQTRRSDLLGLPGYDLLASPARAVTLWERVREAGAQPAGTSVWEPLRIESGTPQYGLDMDETHLAPEVGRTKSAISYSKGCYLGQEPVVRIRDLGQVNRLLTGLLVDTEAGLPRATRLLHNGESVGQVTSSAYSPRFGKVVALGYVRRSSHQPGTILQAEIGTNCVRAEVTPLPFPSP